MSTMDFNANIRNSIVHLLALLIMPVFSIGTINRIKAIWAGRKGPRLNQFFYDVKRLLHKAPVYSEVSTYLFQFSPWLLLATSIAVGLISPIAPGYSPVSFSYDFIYATYLFALGRVFMILAALDTGSSFEGMGASREATYSTFAEPILLFTLGTLGILSGHTSFHSLMTNSDGAHLHWVIKGLICFALFILLQIEAARIPVDDPNTHLELTMIHEVMILDHSGPELAAIQYASALKLTVIAGWIASILNPFHFAREPLTTWGVSISIMLAISIAVGLIESLIARLRLRAVSYYAIAGLLLGIASLILVEASYGRYGGAP